MKTRRPAAELVGNAIPSRTRETPQSLEEAWAPDTDLCRRLVNLTVPGSVDFAGDPMVLDAWASYAVRLLKFMLREQDEHKGAIRALRPSVDALVASLLNLSVLFELICLGPVELPPPSPSAAMKARSNGYYQKPTGGTYLYVARKGTTVLYVGITDDIFHRMAAHRRSSKWWREFTDLSWEEWPDRLTAESRERRLIARHCPQFNWVHNPTRGTT